MWNGGRFLEKRASFSVGQVCKKRDKAGKKSDENGKMSKKSGITIAKMF